jgi:outer membrane autotransporter protein
MKKNSLAMCAAIATLTYAANASAGDSGLYALGSIGKASPGNDKSTVDAALNPTGNSGFTSSLSSEAVCNVLIGWKINPYAAIEGGYVGTASDESYNATLNGAKASATLRAEAVKLVGVGVLRLPANFRLLARLGVAHTHLNESAVGTIPGLGSLAGSIGVSKDGVTYGLGAKYELANQWFFRVDADRYTFNTFASSSNPIGSAVHRTAWGIGAGYQF